MHDGDNDNGARLSPTLEDDNLWHTWEDSLEGAGNTSGASQEREDTKLLNDL